MGTWQKFSKKILWLFSWNIYHMLIENSVKPKKNFFYCDWTWYWKVAKKDDFLSSWFSRLPDRCQVTWHLSMKRFSSSICLKFSKNVSCFSEFQLLLRPWRTWLTEKHDTFLENLRHMLDENLFILRCQVTWHLSGSLENQLDKKSSFFAPF